MVDSMYHSRFSAPLKREIWVSWMFADSMVLWTVLAIFGLPFQCSYNTRIQMKILEPEMIALQHCLKAC